MSGPDSAVGVTELLTPEDFAQYPELAEIPAKEWERQLKFNDRAIVRRRFRKDDVICQEGEYQYTAFFGLEGTAEISINAPIAHVKSNSIGTTGSQFHMTGFTRLMPTMNVNSSLVSSLAGVGGGSGRESGSASQFRTMIPIDATVDLTAENPHAIMRPGDIVGEMGCLSLYPRSATVTALEDCVFLEMQRNVLEMLKKKSKKFNAKIEQTYRERALNEHLRAIPELESLPDSYLEELKQKISLVTYEPGEVIVTEGGPVDNFYLIRIGFVQVSKKYPGGELVLAYMSRGQYFGEVSLITETGATATCKSLDHVELVQIPKAEFDAMLARFPEVRRQMKEKARERLQRSVRQTPSTVEVRLDQFLRQGLMNAQNALLIDLDRCTRCDECVHACADAHEGITRLLRDGLRYDHYLVATSCRQCTDPVCMIGCPVGSIRRRETLEVIIEDWCIGCDKCVRQCPYGNIAMHEFDVKKIDKVYEGQKVVEKDDPSGKGKKAVIKKATTCDLCVDLAEPSCVYACPHDAAKRVDPDQFFHQQRTKNSAAVKAVPAEPADMGDFVPLQGPASRKSQSKGMFGWLFRDKGGVSSAEKPGSGGASSKADDEPLFKPFKKPGEK